MNQLYLAYGANLNQQSMLSRCPQAKPVRSVTVPGWRLKFATHATIEPSPHHALQGALWEITSRCEENLDWFEGYPTYYTKHYLDIDGDRVMVYVMNNGQEAAPSPGYLDVIRQGYQDWQLDPHCLTEALTLCPR
jgi:gamma-glutamylcyclotransferase (GGCT)/AIG2-like uncharacterized protein YtfP